MKTLKHETSSTLFLKKILYVARIFRLMSTIKTMYQTNILTHAAHVSKILKNVVMFCISMYRLQSNG